MSARSVELNYTHFCIEDRNDKLHLLFILMQVCKRDAVASAVIRVFLPRLLLILFLFSASVFHSQWTQLNPWVSKFLVGIFCFKESGSSWCEVTALFEWQMHKSVCQSVWALENPNNCMTFLWHCVLWSAVQSKAWLAVWRLWDMQTLWCMGSFLFAA